MQNISKHYTKSHKHSLPDLKALWRFFKGLALTSPFLLHHQISYSSLWFLLHCLSATLHPWTLITSHWIILIDLFLEQVILNIPASYQLSQSMLEVSLPLAQSNIDLCKTYKESEWVEEINQKENSYSMPGGHSLWWCFYYGKNNAKNKHLQADLVIRNTEKDMRKIYTDKSKCCCVWKCPAHCFPSPYHHIL